MPRKSYTPKNRYIQNSNLSEPDFQCITWLYVQGAPAPDIIGAWDHVAWPDTTRPPSTKTLSKLYCNLGRFIFSKTLEPMLLELFPEMEGVKKDTPRYFEKYLVMIATTMHNFAMSDLDYEAFRIANEGKPMLHVSADLSLEVRKLSAARQGMGSDPLPDLALANFKYISGKSVGKMLSDVQRHKLMHASLLKWLEAEPLKQSAGLFGFIFGSDQ